MIVEPLKGQLKHWRKGGSGEEGTLWSWAPWKSLFCGTGRPLRLKWMWGPHHLYSSLRASIGTRHQNVQAPVDPFPLGGFWWGIPDFQGSPSANLLILGWPAWPRLLVSPAAWWERVPVLLGGGGCQVLSAGSLADRSSEEQRKESPRQR